MTTFSSLLRRYGFSIAAAGALLVLIQNVLLLSGLGLVVGLRTGGYLVPFSLYLDLPGITLIAIGLLSVTLKPSLMSKGSDGKKSPELLGAVSGVLCLLWVILTIAWRVVGLGGLWNTMDVAGSHPAESNEFANAISSLFDQVRIVMVIWIVASISLAMASILFALFIRRRSQGAEGSVAWPFFCLLNAVATVFIASVMMTLAGGEIEFATIVTSVFVKLFTVPLFGIIVYISLSWKFLKLSRTRIKEEQLEKKEEVESSELVSDSTEEIK